MKLRIDDKERDFIPIKDFRTEHQLPPEFSVALFEPKDYAGLGRIDMASKELNSLREHVLGLIPASISLSDLMQFIDHIQFQFQTDLFGINEAVGLKDVEVEFAVAGFGDVLRTMMYGIIPAKVSKQAMTPFEGIYYVWLNDSVRISSQIHEYAHQDKLWKIQVINHVYGRIGLQIHIGTSDSFVYDGVYACPAEGFMFTLLKDTANKIWQALD